jgi:cation:H+ antiporter
LIITPIATELPEKFNSVIWIRAKKDTLAMGNITGAMVFQSCIPTAVGLALTPWILSIDAIVNIIIVYLSVGVVYLNIIRNKGVLQPSALLTGGLFYSFYLIYVVFKVFIH